MSRARYLGQCDRLRRGDACNEAKWHAMMAAAQPVRFTTFLERVDVLPLLDEDGTAHGWIEDHRRSDPSTGAYYSRWGDRPCWFLQTAGFEFIFVE